MTLVDVFGGGSLTSLTYGTLGHDSSKKMASTQGGGIFCLDFLLCEDARILGGVCV